MNPDTKELMELKLEQGKIYFLSYGENTQVLGRFSHEKGTSYIFYDLLHYWNGFETFKENDHCVRAGIEELRRATKPEKHHLFKFEIDNDSI